MAPAKHGLLRSCWLVGVVGLVMFGLVPSRASPVRDAFWQSINTVLGKDEGQSRLAPHSSQPEVCVYGSQLVGQSCMLALDGHLSWNDARLACKQLAPKATLAALFTNKHAQYVKESLAQSEGKFWIGMFENQPADASDQHCNRHQGWATGVECSNEQQALHICQVATIENPDESGNACSNKCASDERCSMWEYNVSSGTCITWVSVSQSLLAPSRASNAISCYPGTQHGCTCKDSWTDAFGHVHSGCAVAPGPFPDDSTHTGGRPSKSRGWCEVHGSCGNRVNTNHINNVNSININNNNNDNDNIQPNAATVTTSLIEEKNVPNQQQQRQSEQDIAVADELAYNGHSDSDEDGFFFEGGEDDDAVAGGQRVRGGGVVFADTCSTRWMWSRPTHNGFPLQGIRTQVLPRHSAWNLWAAGQPATTPVLSNNINNLNNNNNNNNNNKLSLCALVFKGQLYAEDCSAGYGYVCGWAANATALSMVSSASASPAPSLSPSPSPFVAVDTSLALPQQNVPLTQQQTVNSQGGSSNNNNNKGIPANSIIQNLLSHLSSSSASSVVNAGTQQAFWLGSIFLAAWRSAPPLWPF